MPKKSKEEQREEMEARVDWKTRTPKVELGTYELTVTLPNFECYVDKRVAREWHRTIHIPKGEFIIEDYTHHLFGVGSDDEPYTGPPVLRMRRPGVYYEITSRDPRFWLIYAALQKVEVTPMRWLTEERTQTYAEEILDELHARGIIKMGHVMGALANIQRREEEAS